jgi:uncharacterized surface protein with fasciclin (FAS1) repeats
LTFRPNSITFFAVPDSALKRRKRRHHKALLILDDDAASEEFSFDQFVELLSQIDTYETMDPPDKEKWKKIAKKIVAAILKYHILPQELDSKALAQSSTYATKLTYPGKLLGDRPQRLRVHQFPLTGALAVNFISKVVKADIKAKNGIWSLTFVLLVLFTLSPQELSTSSNILSYLPFLFLRRSSYFLKLSPF